MKPRHKVVGVQFFDSQCSSLCDICVLIFSITSVLYTARSQFAVLMLMHNFCHLLQIYGTVLE